MNVLATSQKDPRKNYRRERANDDFQCIELENAKKKSHFFAIMKKNVTYID